MKNISFRNTEITAGFWKQKQDLVKKVTVNAVYDRFKDTHRFDALSCTWHEGEPNMPHIFWDSDVAKWIEGVAYLLDKEDFPALRDIVEDCIDKIINNSDENGYFNSHFLVTRKDERFHHRAEHELYCAGHLIEAAVAYYETNGDKRFISAMCRYADYIERVFKIESSAKFITPGHPELELALVRLYSITKEERYLKLAEYFIDQHGNNEKDSPIWTMRYNQDEIPLKERTTIDGHSVRAFYLFAAVADIARLRGDTELTAACKRVFENTVNKRMYITGGVGSTHVGETFTVDYDLSPRHAYAETCAAISLVYFSSRMQLLENDSKYADCIERIIYNGFISGLSLDGKAFFYENPLEIDPAFNDVHNSTGHKDHFAITERKEVFDCSCCPPNIVRFIPSIADYMYTYDENTLFVHQYIASKTSFDNIRIDQHTDYPRSDTISISCSAGCRKIALRIPQWCKDFTLNCPYVMENGYAVVEASEIELTLSMPVVAVRANRKLHASAGRIAFMRGPVVYCAEGVDNGRDVCSLRVEASTKFIEKDSKFFFPTLHTTAYSQSESEELYSPADTLSPRPITLIPYHAFANRGTSEMCVWLLEK